MKKIKKVVYCLILVLVFLPVISWAAAPTIPPAGTTDTVEEVYTKFSTIVNYVFGIGLGLAIIYMIMGAIGWITAGGDEEKMITARKNLLYSLIGIAVITGIWVLIAIVSNFIGVKAPTTL